MAILTVRNLPDEVHRALRQQAARHGRSTEAEILAILEVATRPASQIKLGSLINAIALEAGALSEAEAESINQLRNKTASEPPEFE